MNYIKKKKLRIKLWLLAIAVVFLIFYFYTLTSLNNDWNFNKLNQGMLSMIHPSLKNYFNKSSLIIWNGTQICSYNCKLSKRRNYFIF